MKQKSDNVIIIITLEMKKKGSKTELLTKGTFSACGRKFLSFRFCKKESGLSILPTGMIRYPTKACNVLFVDIKNRVKEKYLYTVSTTSIAKSLNIQKPTAAHQVTPAHEVEEASVSNKTDNATVLSQSSPLL